MERQRLSRTTVHPSYQSRQVTVRTAATGGYIVNTDVDDEPCIADDLDEVITLLKKSFDKHEDLYRYSDDDNDRY
jgi:hypothetical protein